MNKRPLYITTTLPYVNADPHIGHVLEFVQADAVARYARMKGREVVFNSGTDEHGQKIFQEAEKAGLAPKEFCDIYAAKFEGLKLAFELSFTNIIRTTDPHHIEAAQEMWRRCFEQGDIYKKKYTGLYCVSDEMFLTEKELVDGKCPNHPTKEPIEIEEENYFFAFSKYQDQLLGYLENEEVIVPAWRRDEAINFVKNGLLDFSISRSTERMPWGVPVPNDDTQVMYVWFDALTNYISTLDWPNENGQFDQFWNNGETIQVAGKDQIRFQSLMWQAMLMSAGVKNTERIFYHGFIVSEGQKMSKSIGNVIEPYEIVGKYGAAATRFYLLGAMAAYSDGDFSIPRFEELYTAHLVNGIGNLTSRVLSMVEKYNDGIVSEKTDDPFDVAARWKQYDEAMTVFQFEEAAQVLLDLVTAVDGFISEQKPWEVAKAGDSIDHILYPITEALWHIALMIHPIMPEVAVTMIEKKFGRDMASLGILEEISVWGQLQPGDRVTKGDLMFPRLEDRVPQS